MAAGKVMMDRNPRDELIARWQRVGRLTYVVTPRFAVTSSPAQLEAAGALWREHPTTLMRTHLSENLGEIGWVKELHPGPVDYLGIYEKYGLLGPGANSATPSI